MQHRAVGNIAGTWIGAVTLCVMAQLFLVPLATAIGVPASEFAIELERGVAEPCSATELPASDGSDDTPSVALTTRSLVVAAARSESRAYLYGVDLHDDKQFRIPAVRAPPAQS